MSAAAVLRLDGELTIYRVSELKPVFADALAQAGDTLTVDLAEVGELDSAGVQLLIATSRSAVSAGKTLALTGLGDAAREALQLLGADGLLPELETATS